MTLIILILIEYNERQRIPKGLKKGNPEKLATQGAQDTGQINVREYRRGLKRVIQRNWQHRVHRTNKCQRIPKGLKKGNPEKLATLGAQDT